MAQVEHKDYFEKIEDRMDPENYEEQLLTEAINFLNGVFRYHPQIWIHLRSNGEASDSLRKAEDLPTFRKALLKAFGADVVHMLETAEQDLAKAVGPVFAGRTDASLGEIYAENPEMVLHINDVKTVSRKLISGLKEEFLPIAREPVLASGPLH